MEGSPVRVRRGSESCGGSMSTSRRIASQDRGRETQQRVLAGAAEVFGVAGYGSASLRTIAEACGVSLGAINFHFRTKEQIALGVVEEQRVRSLEAAERVLAERQSPLERMIHLSRALAELLMTDAIVRAGVELSLEVGTAIDPNATREDGWSGVFAAQLAAAVDAGEIVSDLGTDRLADTLLGCISGVQALSRLHSDRTDLPAAIADLWLMLLPGIVAPEHLPRARDAVAAAFAVPVAV